MNANASIFPRGIVTRVSVVVLTTAVLILAGPILAKAVLPIFFILILIPTTVLLTLTFVVAGISFFAFPQRKFPFVAFLIFLMSQAILLTVWSFGWTAESAFNRHLPIGAPVLDPQLDWVLMNLFWVGAAFALGLASEAMLHRYLSHEAGFPTRTRRMVILLVLLEGFLVVSLTVSRVNYRRYGRGCFKPIVSSAARGANREIRLLPMNAGFDTNGLVISRRPRALVWRTAGEIGDLLSESDGERFVWADHDSKAYLLFQLRGGEVPVFGFDFVSNQSVEPKLYRETQRNSETSR